MKRSRYTNSSHTKYAFEKQPYLPSKSLKKKKKTMKQPEVKASSFPGVLHYKECLKIYFKVPATLPKKSHYIQYSEKDTKLSHPMSIYGELSSSPHLCCAPREYFSSKFTGKKKKLYNLHKLHLLHIPKITGSQYGSYQFTNR